MNTTDQIKWHLAHERSCRCEVCGAGIWLKQLLQLQRVPDYLVLYHKDGNKENTNLHNLELRCSYCAKYSSITKDSFSRKKKRINTRHGHAGSVWYNNGLMSKFLKKNEVAIFERMGWKKGRIVKKGPPDHSGKIRITNGVHNTYAWPNDPLPPGWWRGKANFVAKYKTSSLH